MQGVQPQPHPLRQHHNREGEGDPAESCAVLWGVVGLFVCLFVCLFHGIPVVCGGRRLTGVVGVPGGCALTSVAVFGVCKCWVS